MLESERHHILLSLVGQYRFLTVHDLAERVHASLATVRRDLAKLDERGLIRRVRGGAELIEPQPVGSGSHMPEASFESRLAMREEPKRRIAEAAVSLCEDGETIIVDGGTTTYYMAEFLLARHLQVLTNSLAMAELLVSKSDNSVCIPAGVVSRHSRLILNPFESDIFKDYTASKVFVGVNGIGPMGVTNTDMSLIRLERAMIERGRDLIVLADSTKFGQGGNLLLCGFDRVHTIITDSEVDRQARELVESEGVGLIVV